MKTPIETIRWHLRLTQAELASILGVSRQMVCAYEKGRSMPRFETVKKLMAMAKQNEIVVNAEDFFIN